MKHGLTIDVTPPSIKKLLDIPAGSLRIVGGVEGKTSEFEELTQDYWLTDEDSIGMTIAKAQKHYLQVNEDVTITQQNGSAVLYIIAVKDATITIHTKGHSSLRIHMLVKGANICVNHIQIGQTLVQKYAHVNGSINWQDLVVSESYARLHEGTILLNKNSFSTKKVLYVASKKGIIDIYTESRHHAAQTESDIITKGIITDSAKALSRGLVRIEKVAEKAKGYEQQDALLLSEGAEADAIPNLEILNHDVKCSHGSTVGRINEEQLFYLMSRGLNKKEATKQIVEGYFIPVLDQLTPSARGYIEQTIQSALS